MCCLSSIKNWEVTAKAGQMDKYYFIRMQKHFGCSSPFDLYVNNQPISKQLPLKNYSPFYRLRGQFGWEQDNNNFLLVRDSLLFAAFSQKYRLFVNKFDTESGLEFSEFWKHRGWQHLFVGVGLITLCVGLSLIVSHVGQSSFLLWMDIVLAVLAVVFMLFGVFLIMYKHNRSGDIYIVGNSEINEGFEHEVGNHNIAEATATSNC